MDRRYFRSERRSSYLDSNVIVAGLIEAHAHHEACLPWIYYGRPPASLHRKLEAHNALTRAYGIPGGMPRPE